MNTIVELENWMLKNNIKNTFTPNHRYLTDIGEGLENLKKLTQLKRLFIWQSGISESGREELKKALPSVQIDFGFDDKGIIYPLPDVYFHEDIHSDECDQIGQVPVIFGLFL